MNAELKDVVQRKLSFPFAKRHGVLVRGITNDVADTVCRPGVTPQALAEVRRRALELLGEPLSTESFTAVLARAVRDAGGGDDRRGRRRLLRGHAPYRPNARPTRPAGEAGVY